jgi:gliding motility-associated-like protein
MKIKLSFTLVVLALLAFVNTGKAQYEIDPIYYTQFSPDSLAGFDETAARASAINEQFLGSELKIKMYRLKREYIDNKYGIVRYKPAYNTNNYLNANRPAAVPACVNEDFEASAAGPITASNQVTGWTVNGGYNGFISSTSSSTMLPYFPGGLSGPTSCNLLGCCPLPPQNSAIVDCSAPGGFIDTYIGAQYPIFSVFGTGTVSGANAANPQIQGGLFGNKVLRLNDELTGDYSIEKLSKTFSVTSQNALFQFAFISIFAPGHGCCDAGGFQIRLSNATANTVIPCPSFSVSAPSSQCTATVPYTYYNVGSGTTYSPNVNFGNIYHPWNLNSMDLSSYIGQNITIDIIVTDCNAGGHFGCIYFDAQCGPMTVYGNGNAYDAGSNVTVPTCGAAGATICAANGLGPYSWAGPGLTTNNTIPSYTNQCIITSVSAQYTLYMNPAGSCAPIQRIVNSTITPAPLLAASAIQATCGSLSAIVTVTPSGSALNPSTLIWSPAPFSLNTNSTSANYSIVPNNTIVVTITASDPLGCLVTATAPVNPSPPFPTFTVLNVTNSNSITCEFPSINLVANTNYNYNGGSLDYFWASASATNTANDVTITIPGNYTVQAIDPITLCGISQIVTIGVNTVAPLSTISPTIQSVICSAVTNFTNIVTSTTPSVNITQFFYSPTGGTYSTTSNIGTYPPGTVGEHTFVVLNNINGCSTTKTFSISSNQGFPTYSVVSPQNYTLGCNSKSVAVVQVINASATNSLQLPTGGAVTYTLIGPPTNTATPPGTLSIISSYSVVVPGTWTVIVKDNVSLCESRTPISILSNTFAPNVSAIVPNQVLDCDVPRVTLTGQSTTDNVSYTWLFPGSPGSLQSDTIQVNANFSAPNASLIAAYTVEVTDNSSTCTNYSIVTMNQNLALPKAGISNGGVNAISCKTSTITLTNISSTGINPLTGYPVNKPVIGFLWKGPSPQEPQSNTSTYLASTIGVYTLTAKDLNNGCTSETVTTIADNIIYPILDQTKKIDTLDCGDNTVLTLITVVSNPTPGLTYLWNTPPGSVIGSATVQNLPVSDIGLYSVLVTNSNNGCANLWETEVINGTLTANFSTEPSTGYAPLTVNFTNLSSSANAITGKLNITSTWNFGNGTSIQTKTAQTLSSVYNQPGTYTVTLYAVKGSCSESKKQVIKVEVPSSLVIPNVFTPNGDGVNDIYFVKASNLTEISMVIIDRWGHKVYEVSSASGNIEWDGKNMSGKEAAEGTYFYMLKASGKDGKPYESNGQISLLR